MSLKSYWLSLPERLLRSTVGVGAGVVREVSDLAIPESVRHGQLYRNLVDTTLRFLIERVGAVEGAYKDDEKAIEGVLARRTAGNAIEALGIVAFRASPVWVLAALADVCGAGRHLIPEIAEALKAEGLIEQHALVTNVDQLLDALERTSARLAETVNTPPLDTATLRAEWSALRRDATLLRDVALPSSDSLRAVWEQLKDEADRQQRSIFETSSLLGLSAVRKLPDNLRWFSASARVGAVKTGEVVSVMLLEHYRTTLNEIRRVGYGSYAVRQLGPYVRAAAGHFSPKRVTLTERLLAKMRKAPTLPQR